MSDMEIHAGEKATIKLAAAAGGVAAVASAVLSAMVSAKRGAAFLVGGTAGWVVGSAGAYLYIQYRARKAIESIFDADLADPAPEEGSALVDKGTHPGFVYYTATSDPVSVGGEIGFPWSHTWWVGAWSTAQYGSAAQAIYVGALQAQWSALLSVPVSGELLKVPGTGGWLQEWSVVMKPGVCVVPGCPPTTIPTWHRNPGRRWRLGGPEPAFP
jgi:hypothetical protein